MYSFVMIIKASLAYPSIFTNDAVITARLSRQVPMGDYQILLY